MPRYYLMTTPMGDIVQRDDGACIPPDPDNIDWQAYQMWLAETAEGEMPECYDETQMSNDG